MEILLTAVKKGYVEQYISIAESCGLALEAIDVDCFALANAFSYNLRDALTASKTVALLNIGDRYTNLDILKRDVLSFSRDIQIGGRDFNEAIARVCGVDIAAAERIKIHPEERTVDIGMAVRMVLANLIDEIRLSFGYFENKFGKNIDHVYLSGGSCGLAGLKEFIDENLGVKSALWDPLGSIVIDTAGTGGSIQSDIRLSLAVSIGLALR
jgi:type IV pilus assembly protein PilM